MAKSAGRTFIVKANGNKVASLTQKSLTYNATPIDVTDDDTAGDATYLENVFQRETLVIQVDGFTNDNDFIFYAMSPGQTSPHLSTGGNAITVEYVGHNGDTVEANFVMTNFRKTGGEAAGTFSATLTRNRIHTFTAAV